ncbi:hypothetical protein NQ317_008053 [Molorchus minor]|uniref:Uncharacterized protein n=1 Tax=Molorchus minor TaxID=1323400 RepID=A0ABQ9ITT7_9CUCU|nr:hypothetical protein NQ317_008053 [Molorchus minor]
MNKNPDQFLTEELLSNVEEKILKNQDLPYIAAKFSQRNIPYTYHLGTVPPGDPPLRLDFNIPTDNDVKVSSQIKEAGVLWIIGPTIAAVLLLLILVILFILRKRRQPCKIPDQTAVTRPLLQPDINNTITPSDPVEIHRLNFQTPAMISHPPIPLPELGKSH